MTLEQAGPEVSPNEPGRELGIREILDAMPFYVLLVDEDHYILEANKAVYTHLGADREKVLGQYCPLVIHGTAEPFDGCPLEEAALKNSAIERELRDKKTGRWVRSAIYPTGTTTPGGKRIFLHIVLDVTERKLAQEQLKASHARLRRLSAYLESVREEEKRKIARDLHDETSQLLSSLHIYLETAIQTLPEDAARSREILKNAQKLSTTILDEIHKLIYELRPSTLDTLGLVPAVKSLAETVLKSGGLEFSLQTTGHVRRLPALVEMALFRLIQESFNNILKHARAKHILLSLNFRKNLIQLTVQDDGIGFNVQTITGPRSDQRGLGILGMRERVKMLNGSLILDSQPGRGTRITIEMPLGSEAELG